MNKDNYIPGDLCLVKGKVESVCEVDRDNDFSITTDQHPFLRLSQVKPIPLTCKILEKNGWDHKDEVYFKEYPKRKLVIMEESAYIVNESCSMFLCQTKYVHQLQNLLFGLNINSEMEV